MWVDSERGVIVDQDKTRAERAVQHIPGAQLLDYRQGYFCYPANLHSIQIARMLGSALGLFPGNNGGPPVAREETA